MGPQRLPPKKVVEDQMQFKLFFVVKSHRPIGRYYPGMKEGQPRITRIGKQDADGNGGASRDQRPVASFLFVLFVLFVVLCVRFFRAGLICSHHYITYLS